MTAPYLARSPQLFGNPGAPAAPTRQVDIAGSLDALTQGATSLLHATMLRKQAEFERQQQINQAAERRNEFGQRLAFEQQTEATRQREHAENLAREAAKERREFLMAGGVPAHDEQQIDTKAGPESLGTTPITVNAGLTPVHRAMTARSAALPPAYTIDQPATGAPATPLGSTTVQQPVSAAVPPTSTVHVPESYDPTKAASYLRSAMVQSLRNEGLGTKQEHQEQFTRERDAIRYAHADASAKVAHQAAMDLQQLRNQGKTNPAARALTANARAQTMREAAKGLITSHGNSYDEALTWLTTSDNEDAAKLRTLEKDSPVSWRTYLSNAHAALVEQGTKQSLSLQHGLDAQTPTEAAGTVDKTRDAVRSRLGGGKAPAAPIAPATAKPSAPSSSITQDEYETLRRGDTALGLKPMTNADIETRYGALPTTIKRRK